MRSRVGAVLVFVGIYLQSVILYGGAVVSFSFYVTHLVSRGIPKFQVGLIGMMPGIGYVCNIFYDFLSYLRYSKKMSLRAIQCIFLILHIGFCTGQGVAELLPTKHDSILVALLVFQRFLQGFIGCLGCKATVQCCRAWFPDHVSLTVGLETSGYFVGGALAILMGGYVYEAYGFISPFLLLGAANFIFWLYNLVVMPKTSNPVYVKVKGSCITHDSDGKRHARIGQDQCDELENEDKLEQGNISKAKGQGLTWAILFPLIALSLTVGLEGFSAAITAPYLHETFGVSIGQGGSYVFVQYIALSIGSATSGFVLQTGRASSNKIMAIGYFVAFVGVLLMFPFPGLHFLHEVVPKLAYFAIFLQGFGCTFGTVAALMVIEDVQILFAKRTYTRENKSIATTLWLCCWMLASYGGHMIALMVMEFLSYEQGGWMMAGGSALSMVICAVLEMLMTKADNTSEVPTLEPRKVKEKVYELRI